MNIEMLRGSDTASKAKAVRAGLKEGVIQVGREGGREGEREGGRDREGMRRALKRRLT
jgi:hypothetical protein